MNKYERETGEGIYYVLKWELNRKEMNTLLGFNHYTILYNGHF